MKRTISNYSSQACPDACFGIIKYGNGSYAWEKLNCIYYSKFFKNSKNKGNNNGAVQKCSIPWMSGCERHCDVIEEETKSFPVLCLVLESPHIDEFDSNGNPIGGPAMGKTGKNIYDFLCSALENNKESDLNAFLKNEVIGKKNRMLVYLMNSIKYQCSMGIAPVSRLVVESNFVDCWRDSKIDGKQDFENGISILCKNAANKCFFINACSNGDYVSLKEMVNESISNILSKKYYCSAPHPITWSQKRVLSNLFL